MSQAYVTWSCSRKLTAIMLRALT